MKVRQPQAAHRQLMDHNENHVAPSRNIEYQMRNRQKSSSKDELVEMIPSKPHKRLR